MEPAEVLKKYAVELLSLPVHQSKFIALLKKKDLLPGNTGSRLISKSQSTEDDALFFVNEIERSLSISHTNFDKLLLVMKEYKDDNMLELAQQMENDLKDSSPLDPQPTNPRDTYSTYLNVMIYVIALMLYSKLKAIILDILVYL